MQILILIIYNSLTEEQQQELATYRQTLLDLPSDYDSAQEAQETFPQKPSWVN